MKSIPFLVLSLLATASFSCKRSQPEAAASPPPPAVTVTKVTTQNLIDTETFTGRIEPAQWTEIRPRVMGHIESIAFKSGQLVNKGDILFKIDPRWYEAVLSAAKAEVIRTEAALQFATQDAARIKSLTAANAIAKEVNESRVASKEIAEAAHLAAISARNLAELDLEQATVRAPISGRISRALLTEGNFISGPGTLLTTIASSEMHVYTDLDEPSYLRLQQYLRGKTGPQTVKIQLDDGSTPIAGAIESLDNRINSNSGSILLRATVPNLDGRLTPGLFARVEVPLSDEKPVILVAESAIGTDQSQKFVLTVNQENKVNYSPVKLGRTVEGKRVILSGLTGNETIIVAGLQRVRPGAIVAPEFAKEEAAR
ncbi:MAG: efflux RND transporter periplasmic adaptor subunit [Akkermansiaceae bacterium]|nr:efflux RND transporter periplasmic adaptor subunit [Akkermansiaceae bacterium]